jgi:murein DD-endopeptidase MepM/ murein hydrolase activator NlpD
MSTNEIPQQQKPEHGEDNNKTRLLLRIGLPLLIIILITVLGLAIRRAFFNQEQFSTEDIQGTAQAVAAATLNPDLKIAASSLPLPAAPLFENSFQTGITRVIDNHTIIPSRERVDVMAYQVEQGDNLFAIAEKYGLRPETVLWGNYDILQDNPRLISPGMELNILPVDGVYYQYKGGKTLRQIAEEFGVDPKTIVEFPGNFLDPYETDLDTALLAEGSWLIIPGGERELTDWGPPAITRSNPASAAYYGAGHCGQIYEGPIGTGTFIYPTSSTEISGYDYDPNIHPALDFAGAEGNAIFAVDNGVVVYAGWSDYGYGYLIVIDHGNGWQSAYAHLSAVGVSCGQNVWQGSVIGALGNTGNSTGAHLHFELRSEIYGKVNPWNFLVP